MSRDIKFRAWLVSTAQMVKVLMLWPGGSAGIGLQFQFPHGDICLSTTFAKEGVILMQYTGLKDTHGTEIYEGDILQGVRNPNLYHVVTWVDDEAGFGCESMPDLVLKTSAGIRQEWILEFEKSVIGNIHESNAPIPTAR